MIIWIASYPKSGNTWIKSLLSSYLYSNNGIFNSNLSKKIQQFPNKNYFKYFIQDFSDTKKISDYWIAAQDRINLFNENKTILFKTHSALCTYKNNSFTNKNNTQAVIYVVRDPRNVITSISNYYSLSIDESYNFMINKNKIISEAEMGGKNFGISTVLGSWALHYKSWEKIKFAPILIVKYEDLIKNTKNSLIIIINFLKKFIDIKIDDKKILNTVNSCNFDNLAKMEKAGGFIEERFSNKSRKRIIFFNLGKKNNWKTLLDKKIIRKIESRFKNEMNELGYL